ncbi:hypothetical protein F0919_18100 [Taibaiella lutea]|uniref:Uncharacterized protein n=1 Tax=Taibaiella lutea TaxID=2608001 RepID=A0A5M6CCH2_9BACT|nr:hypothetical protein [Taibaiella lutea]KAA5532693.1 hypothetical protein F0919_18100 [Taibaiella lutea]
MNFIPHSVSEEKQIREMDAPQLLEYATELNTLLESDTAPVGTSELLALARIQYKHITGVPLTLTTLQKVV